MATTFEIVLIGEDRDFLAAAGQEALDEVERLEEQLSVYIPTSEVSWINARAALEPVRVEPRLFDLLQLAARLCAETQGAFDITAGPLVKAWGFYRQQGVVPSAETIAQTLEQVGMRHIILDAEECTVRFDRAGVEINLGSIGKGYAVDRAVAVLKNLGVEAALIHGGHSTIYAYGAPPAAEGWVIGIRHPLSILPLVKGEKEAKTLPLVKGEKEAEALPLAKGKKEAEALLFANGEKEAEALPFAKGEKKAEALLFAKGEKEAEALPFSNGEMRTETLPLNKGESEGVKHYIATITLRDQALSTSGSYEQFFEIDGKRYSHILDPRTGYPAQGMWSATVITSSATESDALSTAFFVLGEEGARAYCAKRPEVSAVLVPETSVGEDVEVVWVRAT
ncbi:MAG: FAD:protein FMN transferase [Abditibacteriales bacterium]|nr:FAD:protein FMN transferase [Abditibacteriales bacterium]